MQPSQKESERTGKLIEKPALFIGSSSEGLDVARAISHSLRDAAEVTVWNEAVFAPGQGTLETLVNALERFDFSILVMTPDDVVEVRDSKVLSARDNVLFELGLFMGRLGRSRTFVVCSDAPNMNLPSDLAGVTVLRFESARSDNNRVAAVGSASFQVREAIRTLGQTEARGLGRLGKATAQVEDVSERLVRLVEETQERIGDAIAELRRVPQEITAFVPPVSAHGAASCWENIPLWSYPVYEGSLTQPGPELRLLGGETIKYTMGFRSGRPPGGLAAAGVNGRLVVGEWRYPLKEGGELQIIAESQRIGQPMLVRVEAPGDRADWDISITVLARSKAG
jgi:predicted nucleotide-binding protein